MPRASHTLGGVAAGTDHTAQVFLQPQPLSLSLVIIHPYHPLQHHTRGSGGLV